MRPRVETPFLVRGVEYGGARPLFCVPIVAAELGDLLDQARSAHDQAADLVEWRADFYEDLTVGSLIDSTGKLRRVLESEPTIFTLRIRSEGGAQELPQEIRRACIEAVAASGLVDMVDVELSNQPPFLESIAGIARSQGVRVIMSFHDFNDTPANGQLLAKIEMMNRLGADVAKLAVMPRTPADVLRLLEVTLEARTRHPRLALCTMSMGPLGVLSRVGGFLYGSDMAYAVVQKTSAPGQIPLADARRLAESLLAYAEPES